MYIKSIQLRNWKAYKEASFEFPKPGKRKNLVLIGAKNGYGKTSLLESILLCLYGRDAMGLLPRLLVEGSGSSNQERLAMSYDEFMRRALHCQALENGQTSCSVQVVFEDEEDRIRILRSWYFASGSGKHRRGDEEVRIYRGREDDEELETPPPSEEKEEFYRTYISQQILPPSLARFFFFDGEQVQKLAKQDMSALVKDGIEGILGVTLLRILQDDLRTYARDHRPGAKSVDNDKIAEVQAKVGTVEGRIRRNTESLTILTPQRNNVREQVAEKFAKLRDLTGGSTSSLKELYDDKIAHERKRDQFRMHLFELIQRKLSLGLAGRPLRTAVCEQIRAEEKRALWEATKAQTEGQVANLWAALESGSPPLDPALTAEQQQVLHQRLLTGWASLWHPPPVNCALAYQHPYMTSSERMRVIQRIEEIDQLAMGELEGLQQQIAKLNGEIQRIQNRLAQLQGVEDHVKRLADEIEALSAEEKEKDRSVRDLERELESDRQALADQKASLARLLEQQQKSMPEFAKSNAADRLASILGEIIEEAYPRHRASLQNAMTEAFRAMAHKTHVKSIEIDSNLSVRLLAEKGRDLKELDNSAGEDQIFALALIAAIANVTDFSIPVIMDTPLARLDDVHRQKVLDYFTDRAGEQVMLLSQPMEVFGPFLERIRTRVNSQFLIEHKELGNGVGKNVVHAGRFFEN